MWPDYKKKNFKKKKPQPWFRQLLPPPVTNSTWPSPAIQQQVTVTPPPVTDNFGFHHSQPDLISLPLSSPQIRCPVSPSITSGSPPSRKRCSAVPFTADLCCLPATVPEVQRRYHLSINFSTIFVSLRFRLRSSAFSTIVKAQH